MRPSIVWSVCAFAVGCSFPDYVADLDATIVDAADSASRSDVVEVGDTCTAPCGCAPSEAGVDARDADGSDATDASDGAADAAPDAAPVDSAIDASPDGVSDAGDGGATDAIVPVDGAIGESCGPCGTGKKLCVGTTLSCSVEDDRKTVVDSTYASTALTRDLSHVLELAIGYPTHEASSLPYSVQLTVTREAYTCPTSTTPTNPDPACDKCTFHPTTGLYTCVVSKPADGSITLRFLSGQPTEAAPVELGRVSVPATSIAVGAGIGATATTTVVPIDGSVAPLPKGTSIYVEISTDSTAWDFLLLGDRPLLTPAPADVTWWSRQLAPSGAWVVESTGPLKTVLPAYAIDVRGCF